MKVQKAQRNKRYRANHRIIQKAILKLYRDRRKRITVIRISKETKLSKQTLYTHYKNLHKAPEEIKEELLLEFKIELKEQIISLSKVIHNKNERLFYAVILFMAHNKDLFIMLCSDVENHKVLYQIIETIYPMLEIVWFPVNSLPPEIGSERADMYINMCVEMLSKWGYKTKCNIHKSRRYINRLMLLTSEASMRCR